MEYPQALPKGTILVGDYRVIGVLGAGGFGITYMAQEIALGRNVAIKEFFPNDIALRDGAVRVCAKSKMCENDYLWGLERFIEEAQTLARFNHNNIVRVYRYFRENNTAYMVLHFEQGLNFKRWLGKLQRPPTQSELTAITRPLLSALDLIHKNEFLHRDIAPDNIIVRNNGSPVLIDFGSARGEIAHCSKTISALIKPGYSPYELYAVTSKDQGPWTDIYSLGATLYQAVTGKRPTDAPTRMIEDDVAPANLLSQDDYCPNFLKAINKALELKISDRPQSVTEWSALLFAAEKSKPANLAALSEKAEASPETSPVIATTTKAVTQKKPAARAGSNTETVVIKRAKTDDQEPLLKRAVKKRKVSPVSDRKYAQRRSLLALLDEAVAESEKATAFRTVKKSGFNHYAKQTSKRLVRASLSFAIVFSAVGGLIYGAVYGQEQIKSATATLLKFSRNFAADPSLIRTIHGHDGVVHSVAVTDDARRIISASADSTIKIWDINSGRLIHTLDIHKSDVSALDVFGKRAVSADEDGLLVLWDVEDGKQIKSFSGKNEKVSSVAFTGNPYRFMSAGADLTVNLWDSRRGTVPRQSFKGHNKAIQSIAYSPRGHFLAASGADQTIKLWNASTRRLIRTYRGHKGSVGSVAISTDGRRMATGSNDKTVKIWSTRSERWLRTLKGHRDEITAVAFSPDRRLLASGSRDKTIKIWDLRRGKLLRTLTGHSSDVSSVAFSPDGKYVISGSADKTIRQWSVKKAKSIKN